MFKVRATYDYSSPHEDDLSFKSGQIISVTEEVDADWCIGEYTDDTGTKHDGMFPRNFVEKYEPEPPPRPNRASRYKPVEKPVEQPPVATVSNPPPPPPPPEEPQPVQHKEPTPEPEPPKAQPPPVAAAPKAEDPPMSPVSPPSATSAKSAELPPVQAESAKPPAAAKKAPPPVAAKSNAFRDRIAAFNAPAAAPIQPFKPGGAPTNFIKKPFVAPPPSRNAYIPPPKEKPQVKMYRRDEDPEIAERQAQDEEAADKAGLVAHDGTNANNGEEQDQPKLSLKERIALLQKQQQEQAERAAAAHKEKPKRPPPKKRVESHEGHVDDSEDTGLEKVASGGSKPRDSMDQARPRTSHDMKSPDANHNRDLVSENDADQSGAGDTEDAEGTSTSVEDDEDRNKHRQSSLPIRAAAAPSHEPDVGDEQDVEEEQEEEEDELDAETRRKMELRERMAKMSGGMGMGNVFNPMGMAPLPPKKKKFVESKPEENEAYSVPQQRVAIFPMQGMPSARSHEPEDDKRLTVEKETEEQHPIIGSHRADEVSDVEDVANPPVQRTPTGEMPSDRRPVPPPVPSTSRPVPPPVPNVTSPGPGSESGDELTDVGAHAASPKNPTAQGMSPAKRSSYFGNIDDQYPSSPDRRSSSFPLASPASPLSGRPPPPPPPTQAPPSRHADVPPKKVDRNEGETDYEGDYDTDIASGATHKDALKSHTREASMDDSTIADEPQSARSPITPHAPPPLPPSIPRGVPPPPPPPHPAPNRRSTDGPRAAPPVPPVPPPTRNVPEEDDDEYDPYRYTSPPSMAPPAPRAVPPPPMSQPPPPQNRPPPPMPPSIPPVPQQQQAAESSEEDELYSAPPPRKSHDRPPPPPPQAPPHQYAPPPPPPLQERAAPPPPPPQERAAPPPPPDSQPRVSIGGRKSLDANRALGGRPSMDQPRKNREFIASDIDLGASSHWWTQPRLVPPSLQNRKDILVDLSESQSGNTVEKTVSVLYFDYSQTIISARFEANNVSDVRFQQEHMPPPPKQRPDQLENAYEMFGRHIAKAVESKQNTVVGSGTPHNLVDELLKPFKDALPPVSTRAFGALVYANLANASTQSFEEIRPGDIISFRNARFQGKTGPMHAKYSTDVGKPDHVGIVLEWDGSKKKVRVWEQGREHKKVKPESFKMGDLRSGEVRVWRVMSRSWVGWN